MPNEIYHRSNWGESKAEDFGDVYYDHAATNKLYNHSDYYENSDGTDATLKDLNNKASIVLTPTAYSDGSLNTVIPPYGINQTELVTNGDFSDGSTGWTSQSDVTFGDGTVSMDSTSQNAYINQYIITVGKKYRVSITVDALSIANKLELINGSGLVYKVLEVGTNNFDVIPTGNNAFRIRTKDGATSTISSASAKEIQEADFDFSRGSSATRVNEQGLVEDVQILSGELVQNGNFEQIGSELILNGNFDTDSGWSLPSGSSISGGSLNFDGTQTGTINVSQTITSLDLTKIYKVTFTISNYTAGQVKVKISNSAQGTNKTANGTYTEYLSGMTNTSLSLTANVDFIGSIDNVSVKEVGQNWTFGTGWSINDGKIYFDNPTGSEFRQSLATTAGKYRISFDLDITSGTIQTSFSSPSVSTVEAFTTSGTKTVDITTTASFARFRFVGLANSVFNIDNVSVKEVTDDTDLPRIDFTDGTGSLLLEPQRTNLVTYSEDFSTWTTSNFTSNSETTTAPNGDTVGGYDFGDGFVFIDTANLDGTSDYTNSIYIKANKSATIGLRDGGAGSSSNNTDINLTTNWVRFTATSTSTSTGAGRLLLDNRAASGYGVSDLEVFIWGAQLEQGSYATSYIPTNGSTVTRSSELADNSGNADLFNDSEGVLYAEVERFENDTAFLTIGISDNSIDNIVAFKFRNTANFMYAQIRAGGVNQAVMNHTATNIATFNKMAIKYKENDFAFWFNGVEVVTDTSGITPTGLKNLSFDSSSTGSERFNGKTKAVAVFKEALSNDLLERLTGEGYESFRLLAEANNYTII